MSLKKKENQATENLSEISVVNYLREKRDFFEKNYGLLSELKIPHESGIAISLIEKQLLLLREENKKNNKKMCELIEIARQNDELARRMHKLILSLMDDNNPNKIFNLMYESLKKNFHADEVVIRLFVNPDSVYFSTIDEFIGNDSEEKLLFNDLAKKKVPMINAIDDEQQACLFGKHGDSIKSSVSVPLHGANWEGILAIGSFDCEHFQPNMGIELLCNFGEIFSLIIKPWFEET